MKNSVIAKFLLFPCFFLLLSFQDSQPPPSHYEELKNLDWLVGKWSDSDDNFEIFFDYTWDENKNFLINSFFISHENKKEFEGKQIIGWDPANKQIRSWMFDSDGGFGSAIWRQNKDQWVVEMAQTLPDGGSASAINIYKKINESSFSFASTGRMANGEIQQDLDPITLTRSKK